MDAHHAHSQLMALLEHTANDKGEVSVDTLRATIAKAARQLEERHRSPTLEKSVEREQPGESPGCSGLGEPDAPSDTTPADISAVLTCTPSKVSTRKVVDRRLRLAASPRARRVVQPAQAEALLEESATFNKGTDEEKEREREQEQEKERARAREKQAREQELAEFEAKLLGRKDSRKQRSFAQMTKFQVVKQSCVNIPVFPAWAQRAHIHACMCTLPVKRNIITDLLRARCRRLWCRKSCTRARRLLERDDRPQRELVQSNCRQPIEESSLSMWARLRLSGQPCQLPARSRPHGRHLSCLLRRTRLLARFRCEDQVMHALQGGCVQDRGKLGACSVLE